MFYFEDGEEQPSINHHPLTASKPAIFFQEENNFQLQELRSTKEAASKGSPNNEPREPCKAEEPRPNTFTAVVANQHHQEPEKKQPGARDSSEEISFTEKIERKFQEYQHQKDFLYSPTRPNSRVQMAIARRKVLLNSIYVCTLVVGEKTLTMATKRQKQLKGDKYEVSMLTDFLEDIESEPFFVGRINYRDGIYHFTDDGHFHVHSNQTIERRMGSLQINRPLIGEDTLVLLTPSLDNGQICTVEANEMSCLFEISKRSGSVTKLAKYQRTKLSTSEQETINQMMGCRKSKHAFALRRHGVERNCLVMARLDDITFKVEVYEGLSPFQAFCTCLAWLS